jgi:hypothetical protein
MSSDAATREIVQRHFEHLAQQREAGTVIHAQRRFQARFGAAVQHEADVRQRQLHEVRTARHDGPVGVEFELDLGVAAQRGDEHDLALDKDVVADEFERENLLLGVHAVDAGHDDILAALVDGHGVAGQGERGQRIADIERVAHVVGARILADTVHGIRRCRRTLAHLGHREVCHDATPSFYVD